jgi:hypothetical protein
MSALPLRHPTAQAPGGVRSVTRSMDCRATGLHTASFPGKAGFSRRHDGLCDRIYREAVRAGLLAHREYGSSRTVNTAAAFTVRETPRPGAVLSSIRSYLPRIERPPRPSTGMNHSLLLLGDIRCALLTRWSHVHKLVLPPAQM